MAVGWALGRRAVVCGGLAGAALVPACDESADELDPDVVHDLSRRPGDAIGIARSGYYDAEITLLACECPDLAALELLTPCQSATVGDAFFIGLELVQSDGLVLIRLADESVTGGLNVDGSFSAGGVFDLSSPLGSIAYVTRMDGTFDVESSVGAFDATLQRHLRGDIVDVGTAFADTGDPGAGPRSDVDCTERFALEGRRGP